MPTIFVVKEKAKSMFSSGKSMSKIMRFLMGVYSDKENRRCRNLQRNSAQVVQIALPYRVTHWAEVPISFAT